MIPEALTPVLLPTPAVPTVRGAGRVRMAAQRRASRDCVGSSADLRGAALRDLRQDELGAPLPSLGWHWSLTHDGTWCAGVVDEAPVGIDLERVGLRRGELVEAALSPAERDLFPAGTDAALAFTRAWTAKEAVLKAAGVGLLELSRCRLVEVRGAHALLHHRGRLHHVRQWTTGEHLVALTLRDPDQEVRWSGARLEDLR